MFGKSLKDYFRRPSSAQKLFDGVESINEDEENSVIYNGARRNSEPESYLNHGFSDPLTDYESSISWTTGKKRGVSALSSVKDIAKKFSENIEIPVISNGLLQQETVNNRSESPTVTLHASPHIVPNKKQNFNSYSEHEIEKNVKKKKKRKTRKKQHKMETSSDSDESNVCQDDSGNWTLKAKKSEDEYIKLTMADLKALIKRQSSSVVKGDDIEMQIKRIKGQENDFDDTETMNSGLSYSSGNSGDLLLSNRTVGSMHLVNPARVGILKRFLPFTSKETNSSESSAATMETFMSSARARDRRQSLQPEHLCPISKHQHALYKQAENLRGGSCIRQNQKFNMCDFQCGCQSEIKPPKHRCGVTFEDEYYDQDFDNEHDCCQNYRSFNHHKPCCAPRGGLSYQQKPPLIQYQNQDVQMSYNMPPSSLAHVGFQNPNPVIQNPTPVIQNPTPVIQQMPVPVVVNPQSSSTQVTNGKTAEQELLEQLKDAISSPEESKPKPEPKKEENSIEAHFNRVHAMMAEKKKKEQENRPIFIAKIIGLITNTLLVLSGGGVAALGVMNMIDSKVAVYTGVTKTSVSDDSFSYFCYALCFLGGIVTAIIICGFCGTCKTSRSCLKIFLIAVSMTLLIQLGALVFLYISNSVSIPMFSAIASTIEANLKKHLRGIVRQQYVEGSTIALAWDKIQVMAECCGCESADDFKLSAWKNASTTDKKQAIPNSCCVLKEKNVTDPVPTNKLLCHTMTPGFSHDKGCLEVLKAWYHEVSYMCLGGTGGLIIVEILCLICALRLCKKITEKKEREKKKKAEELKAKKNAVSSQVNST